MAEDMFIRLVFFLIGILYSILLDLIVEPTRIRWRKQANYDCKKCKVWDCPAKNCIKKSKYFIIPIILISFFTLNVNAATFAPFDFSIAGNSNLPQDQWVDNGMSKILTVATSMQENNLNINERNYVEIFACVAGGPSWSSYITNDDLNGAFQNGAVNSLNIGISCKTSVQSYNGTIFKFYFKVYKWRIPSGQDVYEVSSYWRFNSSEASLLLDIRDIKITDKDNFYDDSVLVANGKGQDIIINQNKTIINNQNDIKNNTDKIKDTIMSDDSDTTSSKCGIVCKLKGIFTGIANLPSKIGDLLKSLFIPSDEQMSDLLNDTQTQLNSKLGILGLPTSIYTQFLNLLTSDVNENTCIQFDDIKDPVYDQLLIGSSSFCFNTLLQNEKLNTFRTSCLLIVGGLLLLAFVSFLKKQYNRILDINDPDENYEYITSEDSYNIDYSTGEVTGMKHNERKTRREKI